MRPSAGFVTGTAGEKHYAASDQAPAEGARVHGLQVRRARVRNCQVETVPIVVTEPTCLAADLCAEIDASFHAVRTSGAVSEVPVEWSAGRMVGRRRLRGVQLPAVPARLCRR